MPLVKVEMNGPRRRVAHDNVAVGRRPEITEFHRRARIGVRDTLLQGRIPVGLGLRRDLGETRAPQADRGDAVAQPFVLRAHAGRVALAAKGEVAPVELLHGPHAGILRLPVGVGLSGEGNIGGERAFRRDIVVAVEIFADNVKAEASGDGIGVGSPRDECDFVIDNRTDLDDLDQFRPRGKNRRREVTDGDCECARSKAVIIVARRYRENESITTEEMRETGKVLAGSTR